MFHCVKYCAIHGIWHMGVIFLRNKGAVVMFPGSQQQFLLHGLKVYVIRGEVGI